MAIDLTSLTTKQYILGRTQDAIKYDDRHAAQEILRIFRNELPNQQDEVAAVPGLYEDYKNAWVACQFICLPSLADDDFFDLIKDHLVEGLHLEEYDLLDKIGLRISFLDLETEKVTFMEQLLTALRNNESILGTQNIKVNGRMALPTVASWMADYDSYPAQSAQRSDYEQIEYITKSPNAVKLSEKERKILLSILDVYDSLRNLLNYYRSLPEASEADLSKPENLEMLYPGANFVDSIEDEGGATDMAAAPVARQPTPAPAKPTTPLPAKLSTPPSRQTPVEAARPRAAVPKPPAPASVPPAPAPAPAPEPAREEEQVPSLAETMDMLKTKPDPNIVTETPRVDRTPNYVAQAAGQIDDSGTTQIRFTKDVPENIKKNLRDMNVKEPPPKTINIQDLLNERHNTKNKGGLVFDAPPKITPAPTPTPAPPAPAAAPTPTPPPAPAPASNPADDIAKKLAELRNRKQS